MRVLMAGVWWHMPERTGPTVQARSDWAEMRFQSDNASRTVQETQYETLLCKQVLEDVLPNQMQRNGHNVALT